MDFQNLKRRDLQMLCKKNNIPANTTNAAMADALASLPTVEGLEEYLGNPEADAQGSPEKSVITSPIAPRTTARQKALNIELESSKVTTRTRCRTRTRAVEGTDTRKTPATRTTRKRASQEASIQKKTEKDLQADFEADLEQSEVSENHEIPGGDIKRIAEEVSGVTVENEGQSSSESLSEAQGEVKQGNDGLEVTEVNCLDEAPVEEEMLNGSKKVDFHSLARKDLQNLCKKNRIPANMTNAAMAEALESLEIVEGLQELVKECDSQAPSSPQISGITASCARRSRTTMKITREEPRSSKLVAKSCRGSRRRIVEEISECNSDISNSINASLDVEALKEPEAIESKIDENIVEEEVLAKSDVTESDLVKVDIGFEPVAECTNGDGELDDQLEKPNVPTEPNVLDVQKSSNLEIDADGSEFEDGQLENLITAPSDSAAVCLIEKLDSILAENQTSTEFVSESAHEADSKTPEKVVTFASDIAAHISPIEYTENEMSEKSDAGSEDEMSEKPDELSIETNSESDSEGSSTEDEVSEMSDFGTREDDQLSLEVNMDSEAERSQLEKMDTATESVSSGSAEELNSSCQIEKLDIISESVTSGNAEDLICNEINSETSTQADSCLPTETETPLYNKSVRQLKRMLKERLHAATLAKRMESLTLEETEVSVGEVTEDLQRGLVESESENAGAPVLQVPQVMTEDKTNQEEQTNDDETESDDDNVEQKDALTSLHSVDILLDNEVIPEDEVTGNINVATFPPPITPSKLSSKTTKKPVLFTPTKTPVSAARINFVLDVNKENIDNSISKTEPGKIKVAVNESGKFLSTVSMGKLKKEFKVLQQQSETKRQALQSRSENNCLFSP